MNCAHTFIKPNGDCLLCGVFVTSVPGLAKGHIMVSRKQAPPKYIGQVCELFDVTVMSDLSGDGDDISKYTSVYALGWHGEPEAGIRYGTITGWFSSIEELEAFCKRNIGKFQAAAQEDGPAPDATDWQ